VDSGNACGPDGRLPDASLDQKHIRDVFYRMARRPPSPAAAAKAGRLGWWARARAATKLLSHRIDLPACRRSRDC